MPKAIERVSARWRGLMGNAAETALHELIAAYSSAGRHYHNLHHIAALLQLSAGHTANIADRDALDLAIFYHDAVYDAKRSDNEAKSAALARAQLSALGIAPDRVDKIARWIEATKHSSAAPTGDRDLDHLLDFDLSILAAAPAVYEAYTSAIRREYAIFPDLLYRPGRAKVLRAFIATPAIYRMPELAAKWEARARANLAEELKLLCRV